jgi:hypothetical protein
MFSTNRLELREMFFDVWAKLQNKEALSELEQALAKLLLEHPEYETIWGDKEKYLDKDFNAELGEANPFMHLSFHLGVQEQAGMDRPKGTEAVYFELMEAVGQHEAEHLMMDCLAEAVWQSQRTGKMPDDKALLASYQALTASKSKN